MTSTRLTRFIAGAVVVSLGAGLMPATARASERPASAQAPAAHYDLRASIARAAAAAAAEPQAPLPPPARSHSRSSAQQASGGGGGHAAMIISLISAAAGIAGTYYMVKALKKTTDQATQNK